MSKIIVKSILLVIFLLIFSQNPHTGFAYNKSEYTRLLMTRICRRCDLYHAGFSGQDLSNVDLTGSNLILAKFQKATLYNAILTDANISGANFSGAIWTDGSVCKAGSVGRCIKKEKK